jgi:trimethylamine--corrinoid protein Co-methyltransferase
MTRTEAKEPADGMRPTLRYLADPVVADVLASARTILADVGVSVENDKGRDLLQSAGATVDADGRVHIGPAMIDDALKTVPSCVRLYDRSGEEAATLGGQEVHFAPGSAAIKVLDHESGSIRPSTTEDCVAFARLADALPALALQSTCVVPSDVPAETADRHRLSRALQYGRKPIITGTFAGRSFETMYRMLVCVRGGEEALREKPLAVFDCCPTAPLSWSELTCSALLESAERGVPAELISMPMTGATSPVTLLGAITQHAAESLSGVVLHQLAGPGAPLIWGACAVAFDMRGGTTPLGSIESMILNATTAQVGKALGLPTHGYLGLSDSKTPDYQAGLESGCGALTAALAGINVVSGPGMLEFVSCQSLEKLVLDHEACRMALRATEGIRRRDDGDVVEIIREGLAAEHFLNLPHTRKWFREEFLFPSAVIDRQVADSWIAAGEKSAAERAHEEVVRILAAEPEDSLDRDVVSELERLAGC